MELTDDAREDLRELDGSMRRIAIKGMNKLKTDPELPGAPLENNSQGQLVGLRKLVVGNRTLRSRARSTCIVYRLTDENEVVVVVVIGEREHSEVPAMAATRLAPAGTPEMTELAEAVRSLT